MTIYDDYFPKGSIVNKRLEGDVKYCIVGDWDGNRTRGSLLATPLPPHGLVWSLAKRIFSSQHLSFPSRCRVGSSYLFSSTTYRPLLLLSVSPSSVFYLSTTSLYLPIALSHHTFFTTPHPTAHPPYPSLPSISFSLSSLSLKFLLHFYLVLSLCNIPNILLDIFISVLSRRVSSLYRPGFCSRGTRIFHFSNTLISVFTVTDSLTPLSIIFPIFFYPFTHANSDLSLQLKK